MDMDTHCVQVAALYDLVRRHLHVSSTQQVVSNVVSAGNEVSGPSMQKYIDLHRHVWKHGRHRVHLRNIVTVSSPNMI